MTLTIPIPDSLDDALRRHMGNDMNAYAREALAVELYREGKLYHKQFAQMLGLDRWQADEVLRRHGIANLTPEEIDLQFQSIRKLEHL